MRNGWYGLGADTPIYPPLVPHCGAYPVPPINQAVQADGSYLPSTISVDRTGCCFAESAGYASHPGASSTNDDLAWMAEKSQSMGLNHLPLGSPPPFAVLFQSVGASQQQIDCVFSMIPSWNQSRIDYEGWKRAGSPAAGIPLNGQWSYGRALPVPVGASPISAVVNSQGPSGAPGGGPALPLEQSSAAAVSAIPWYVWAGGLAAAAYFAFGGKQ